MPKQVMLTLDDDVYEALVKKALSRYGSEDAISKVVNEELRASLIMAVKKKALLEQILSEEKPVKVDLEEFYNFRRELSKRFEEL
ncbi:MAG: hypothetical protein DRJ98_08455 [Thermoprotei archaeon]|nr:MAG: hypothetical protein DRJ98_08455 [Thermoprotei archaeon]